MVNNSRPSKLIDADFVSGGIAALMNELKLLSVKIQHMQNAMESKIF